MTDGQVQLPSGDETLKGTARSLLVSVNDASAAARNGWLFFLALIAYLFIAAASVSHKDLLLNTPVVLPFLGIALRLDSFFLFAPMVLLFMHFGLLVQHVLLSRKIIELDTILREDEAWRGKRTHPLRLELHSYYYTQALSGAARSAVFATFLHGMVWLSLVVLPVFLILYFQVTFLPYHSENITWAHRIYLFVEIIILLGVGIFLPKPNANFWQAIWRSSTHNSTNFFGTLAAVLFALFFSVFVATFPGERVDLYMKKVGGWTKLIKKDKNDEAGFTVFTPTAYFFSNTGHTFGGLQNMFHRNLIVVDEDLVSDDETVEDVSISLRGRDLRQADFSRSDLHKADFTDAQLDDANFNRSILNNAKFGCTKPYDDSTDDETRENYVDRGCSTLTNADFTLAELKGANFGSTYGDYTKFDLANLSGANFDKAILSRSSFENAKGANVSFAGSFLYESNFYGVQMPGANFSGVVALATNFSEAVLAGSDFASSHLQGTNFEFAKLNVVDLTLAGLWSTKFSDAEIDGSIFSYAEIWGPVPPNAIKNLTVALENVNIAPPSESRRDGLNAILNSKTLKLRPETRELINVMLSDKSMKEWQLTDDYKVWDGLKTKFSSSEQQVFIEAYTAYVTEVVCQSIRTEPEKSYGVITRVSRGDFPGDIEKFLNEIKKPTCNAFDLISKDLRDELLKAVDAKKYRSLDG